MPRPAASSRASRMTARPAPRSDSSSTSPDIVSAQTERLPDEQQRAQHQQPSAYPHRIFSIPDRLSRRPRIRYFACTCFSFITATPSGPKSIRSRPLSPWGREAVTASRRRRGGARARNPPSSGTAASCARRRRRKRSGARAIRSRSSRRRGISSLSDPPAVDARSAPRRIARHHDRRSLSASAASVDAAPRPRIRHRSRPFRRTASSRSRATTTERRGGKCGGCRIRSSADDRAVLNPRRWTRPRRRANTTSWTT